MAGSLASINIKFSADLKGFSSEMQTAVRDVAKLGDSFATVGRGLTLGLTTPILGLGGLAVKTAADFETLRTSLLSSFQGNQAAADSAFKTIEKFATSSPYQVEEVLNAFIKLKNLGLDPSEEALTSYGNTASAMGKDLNQMIEAVADASTGEFERLKEFGIKSKSEGDKVSFTFQGVTTTVGKNSKEIEGYLMNIGNVNFAGAMDRQSETFKGRLSTLQDTLASFGDSIGSIILEFMSPMIDSLQELAEYFKKLSPETQKTIVVIAGLAAAIGPLLLGIGSLMQLVPVMVAGFTAIKTAFLSLTATMAANPFGVIAIAIGLAVSALYLFSSATKEVVSSKKALNDAIEKGNEKAGVEISTLDKLYKSATNVKEGTKERKKAVDELQALYPAYFGNLKDEAILNGEVSKTYKQLREDIFNKARAIAVENELQTRANERIKTENKLRQDIINTESEIARIRKGADVVVLQEANAIEKTAAVTIQKSELLAAQNKLLDIQKSKLERYYSYTLGQDKALLDAKTEFSSKTGLLDENELLLKKQLGGSIVDNKKKLDETIPGTIAFYEAKIALLEKEQKTQVKTSEGYYRLQNEIDAYQKKIDAIAVKDVTAVKVEPIKIEPIDSNAFIQSTINANQEYLTLQQKRNEDALLLDQEFQNNANAFNEGIASIMQSVGQNFAAGFGEMLGQSIAGGLSIQSVWTLMITALADMAIQVGKLAIGIGISVSGIKKALTSLNPVVAIAAGIALVALGTLAKSALSNIASGGGAPAFANGGVVPGTSLYGDKILARVNSGELILNQKQQSNLWGMMNSAGQGVNVNLEGGFRLAGSDLELVIERAVNKNSRKR